MAFAPIMPSASGPKKPSTAEYLAGVPQPAPVATPVPNTPGPIVASNASPLPATSNQNAPAPIVPAKDPVSGLAPPPVGTAPKTISLSSTEAPKTETVVTPPKVITPAAPKPLVTATEKPKAVKVEPTPEELQLEALKGTTNTIKQMIEGNDVIAQREFNSLISQITPKNKLAMHAYAMKLNQSGNGGPGAGDALLAVMASEQGFTTDQLIAQIGVRSSERLYDLNKWGFEKSQEIEKAIKSGKREDFNAAIALGQYDMAGGLWEEMFPGIPFDAAAAKMYDPVKLEAFTAKSKLWQQYIDQGNPDKAKEVFLDLARSNPEAFGFATAEEALAALSDIDFSQEAWANTAKVNDEVNTAIRTAALAGDRTSAMSAIERHFANMVPGSAEKIGGSKLSDMTLEQINEVLKANDKTPVTAEEVPMMDKAEFAKDELYAQNRTKAKGANGVDMILDQFLEFNPGIGIDPVNRSMAKAWIFENLAGMQMTPDGDAISGFTFKENAGVPPWDPASVSSHLYVDWPMAKFDASGLNTGTTYEGFKAYDDNNKSGDLSTLKGQEDAKVDKAWEKYVFDTRSNPSERLSTRDWFFSTKGGTAPVNSYIVSLLQNKPISLAPTDGATAEPKRATTKNLLTTVLDGPKK